MPFSELFFLSCFSTEALAPVKLKSISGFLVAFFRRCLIYNVLICLRSAPSSSRSRVWRFLILPHSSGFVKNFFQEFFRLPTAFPFSFLRRPVQLDYFIRFKSVCQAPFSSFFRKTFRPLAFPALSRPDLAARSRTASSVYHSTPAFVNTFFPSFSSLCRRRSFLVLFPYI